MLKKISRSIQTSFREKFLQWVVKSALTSRRGRIFYWAANSAVLFIISFVISSMAPLPEWTIFMAAIAVTLTGCVETFLMLQKPLEKRSAKKFSIRFWNLAGMFFDRKTRALMYDPTMEEMHDDFLLARKLCRSKADYWWLKFCFTKRASLAWLRAFGVTVVIRPALRLMPTWLKHWLNLFS